MRNTKYRKMYYSSSPHLIVTPTYLESGKLAFIEVSGQEKSEGNGDNIFLKKENKVIHHDRER